MDVLAAHPRDFFPDSALHDPRLEHWRAEDDWSSTLEEEALKRLVRAYPREFLSWPSDLTFAGEDALVQRPSFSGHFRGLCFAGAAQEHVIVRLLARTATLADCENLRALAARVGRHPPSGVHLWLLATKIPRALAAALARHGVRATEVPDATYRAVAAAHRQVVGERPPHAPRPAREYAGVRFTVSRGAQALVALVAAPARLRDGDQLLRYCDSLRAEHTGDVTPWLIATEVPRPIASVFDRYAIRHAAVPLADYARVATRHGGALPLPPPT